jgi:phosphoglycolate phosphatase-like HAD superfamily hydrolase
MADLQKKLKSLNPKKKYFIGIDSDGCAFDTMEIKQKECFCPNTIRYFHLQAVSKYAREVSEFVNLYSRERGKNRFQALVSVMDLLRKRSDIRLRGTKIPRLPGLRAWIKRETRLGNPALATLVKKTGDPELKQVLAWTNAINRSIKDMVRGVPPFPFVRESLKKAAQKADIVVVSQTPVQALKREWQEHGINGYVRIICGQEYGTKSQHIKYAAVGKYPRGKILMIGDALGDLKAARDNGVLFYPILPCKEEESWEIFFKEALDRFFSGKYEGAYQRRLVNKFKNALPATPFWQ